MHNNEPANDNRGQFGGASGGEWFILALLLGSVIGAIANYVSVALAGAFCMVFVYLVLVERKPRKKG